MTTTNNFWAAAITLTLLGCGGGGGGKHVKVRCDFNKVPFEGHTLNQCVDVSIAPADEDKLGCAAIGGTLSFEPCRTAGMLGRCDHVDLEGYPATYYLFADDVAKSEIGAKTECDNLGGDFTPASQVVDTDHGDGNDQPYPDGNSHAASDSNEWSCSLPDVDVCEEFPSVVAGDRADAIKKACSGGAVLKQIGCPRSGASGYCEGTGDGVGLFRFYFYSPDSEAADAQNCNQHGTWYTL